MEGRPPAPALSGVRAKGWALAARQRLRGPGPRQHRALPLRGPLAAELESQARRRRGGAPRAQGHGPAGRRGQRRHLQTQALAVADELPVAPALPARGVADVGRELRAVGVRARDHGRPDLRRHLRRRAPALRRQGRVGGPFLGEDQRPPLVPARAELEPRTARVLLLAAVARARHLHGPVVDFQVARGVLSLGLGGRHRKPAPGREGVLEKHRVRGVLQLVPEPGSADECLGEGCVPQALVQDDFPDGHAQPPVSQLLGLPQLDLLPQARVHVLRGEERVPRHDDHVARRVRHEGAGAGGLAAEHG
mmetsp:Transcript_5189/g.14663  ORF Transcript_5189/g.14663 Transcript_5189/m.14663 type:complete len:307 (-) Transcript_5189:424-1344(-)